MTRGTLPWAIIASSMLMAGCFQTRIHNGTPAADASIEHDQSWHHGFVWGMAELSGPYELNEICPQGWAEILTETSFTNGVAEVVAGWMYSPQTVTVRCRVGGESPAHNIENRAKGKAAAPTTHGGQRETRTTAQQESKATPMPPSDAQRKPAADSEPTSKTWENIRTGSEPTSNAPKTDVPADAHDAAEAPRAITHTPDAPATRPLSDGTEAPPATTRE